MVAFSISGVSTYVMVPAMSACFDLGHCAVEAARLRNVLLTHTHQDHCLGAIRHRSLREMWGSATSRIYLPQSCRDDFVATLAAFAKLEQREFDHEEVSASVIGVHSNTHFELSPRYQVHCFAVTHRIDSIGYRVVENRRKLKARYDGWSGEELGEAHRRGAELYDFKQHPVLTYIGDSTIETLQNTDDWGDTDVLFLECTHVGATDLAVSTKYGHTHLDQLVRLFEREPERFGRANIVLKHWSMRYSQDEVLRATRRLPPALAERITLLL
jgi:ribonuclease Z